MEFSRESWWVPYVKQFPLFCFGIEIRVVYYQMMIYWRAFMCSLNFFLPFLDSELGIHKTAFRSKKWRDVSRVSRMISQSGRDPDDGIFCKPSTLVSFHCAPLGPQPGSSSVGRLWDLLPQGGSPSCLVCVPLPPPCWCVGKYDRVLISVSVVN